MIFRVIFLLTIFSNAFANGRACNQEVSRMLVQQQVKVSAPEADQICIALEKNEVSYSQEKSSFAVKGAPDVATKISVETLRFGSREPLKFAVYIDSLYHCGPGPHCPKVLVFQRHVRGKLKNVLDTQGSRIKVSTSSHKGHRDLLFPGYRNCQGVFAWDGSKYAHLCNQPLKEGACDFVESFSPPRLCAKPR
jgi:hypothetical protein